jgi:TPR repeat protein
MISHKNLVRLVLPALLVLANLPTSTVLAAPPTPKQITMLVDEALAGSAIAAKKLITIYKDDEKVIRYWRVIAAENGDLVEQYNLWFVLSKERNPLSQKRALYWLKRAAAAGDAMSKQRLRELDHKSSASEKNRERGASPN